MSDIPNHKRVTCPNCSSILHTGEARVLVPMSARDLEALAVTSFDSGVTERLLTALGLIDPELVREVRDVLAQQDKVREALRDL